MARQLEEQAPGTAASAQDLHPEAKPGAEGDRAGDEAGSARGMGGFEGGVPLHKIQRKLASRVQLIGGSGGQSSQNLHSAAADGTSGPAARCRTPARSRSRSAATTSPA